MLVFGTEAGSGSCGWAVLKDGSLECGSLIFPTGRDPNTSVSLASKRRSSRQTRRRIRRRRQRMRATLRLLRQHLWSDFDPKSRTTIQGRIILPDEAMARLIKDDPSAFGGILNYRKALCVALYKFPSLRGFQSQLKKQPIYDDRPMTRGEEMYKRRMEGKISRLKPGAREDVIDDKPKRIHIREEFEAIMERAIPHLGLSDDAIEAIRHCIFYQRPLKDVERGRCTFMRNEERAHSHEAVYQRFIIRQDLANLRCIIDGSDPMSLAMLPEIDELEEMAWDKRLSWAAIQKHLRSSYRGRDIFLTNSEGQASEGRKGIGPAKVDVTEDDEGNSTLKTGNISAKAAELIYNRMKDDGITSYEAISRLANERDDFELGADTSDVKAGTKMLSLEDVEEFTGVIIDPTVRMIYGQYKRMMDDLVKHYGIPDAVHVESARDIGRGKKAYLDAQKKRVDNRQANERRGSTTMFARLKDAYGSDCFYCGKRPADVKEHIIPRCESADNSFYNQVPSCHGCNDMKGDLTPFDVWAKTDQWSHITSRLANLEKTDKTAYRRIAWRFEENAIDSLDAGFHGSHLHSLRYAEKIIRVGLSPITKEPNIIRGLTTAQGRRHYGIRKDRYDHRHHAQDAIIIALAPWNRKQGWPTWITKEAILDAYSKAVVSHRCDRSKVGALHNETSIKHSEATSSHIQIGSGSTARYHRPDGNWATEVYQWPSGTPKAGKWEAITITRFDANKPSFRAGKTYRPHPAARLVMRLHVNDTVSLIEDDGEESLWRVKKMSGKTVTLIGIKDATPDVVRNKMKPDDRPRNPELSASGLQKRQAILVNISPIGKWQSPTYQNFKSKSSS